jgi:hypothetical protein
MKLRNWLTGWATMCVAMMFATATLAQDKKDDKKPAEPAKKDAPAAGDKKPEAPKDAKAGGMPEMTPEQMKEMEAYMKAATPGKEHELLKKMAGSWTYAMKHRHDANSPWEEMSGTIERKLLMGGRFLQEEVKGPAFMPDSPPFEGMGLSGYDNVQKKYWGTWMDNWGTGIMQMVGTADATGKVITFSAEYWDPITGKPKKQKHVSTIKDDKTHQLQMYDTDKDGKEFLMFDMTCTKK